MVDASEIVRKASLLMKKTPALWQDQLACLLCDLHGHHRKACSFGGVMIIESKFEFCFQYIQATEVRLFCFFLKKKILAQRQ